MPELYNSGAKKGKDAKVEEETRIKAEIERLTGISAGLLTGESTEENIAQAKALLAYKRSVDEKRQTEARRLDSFLDAQQQIDQNTSAFKSLEALEAQTSAKYPNLHDAGEANHGANSATTKQLFAEWLNGTL